MPNDVTSTRDGWRGRRRLAWWAAGVFALSSVSAGRAAASAEEGSDSPLGDLMGWTTDVLAEERRLQLEVENLIARCMAELGWEYRPIDPSADLATDPGAEDRALLATDPQAYGERYGYGVMRDYEINELPWIEDPDGSERPVGESAPVDPNAEYILSLSPDEFEQYAIDLDGELVPDTTDADGMVVGMATDDTGCSDQAEAEVYADLEIRDDPNVRERIDDYYASVNDDPRLRAENDAWLDCMGDAVTGFIAGDGRPVRSPDDMTYAVGAAKFQAQGLEPVPFEDESELDGLNPAAVVYDGPRSGIAWVGAQTAIPDEHLDALIQEELDLWQQDQDCVAATDRTAVRRTVEQEFVDQLLAAFPQLAIAAEAD